ncbi:MAG: NAD+ synthase [Candidatus Marinimicrobia bacterium]|nr:NAD+ synthase [Candidatus Neomarinimicrobiota bacterium]
MDLKIALAQINFTVGDVSGNAVKIIEAILNAKKEQADIILFPELALCGYPPLDLVLEKEFVTANKEKISEIAVHVHDIVAIVGLIREDKGKLWNDVAIIQDGKIIEYVHKINLPTYDIFDELRYFNYINNPEPVNVKIKGRNYRLGIEICEDLWDDRYETKVTRELAKKGAEIILNASASPYQVDKIKQRIALVREKVLENKIPFVYVNLIGGQDELIFDGNSFALDKDGNVAAFMPASEEAIGYCEIKNGKAVNILPEPPLSDIKGLHAALLLGIRDYFHKSGFKDAVIGLSGGIDSALVATLATEALGADHVSGFAMPSKFSSDHSLKDAEQLANNLGIHFDTISVEPMYESFLGSLEKQFAGTSFGLAEENLQARVRGTILMSIANKKKALVLTTGNKTEIALGYCTLYGDMCGALGPISDLNKLDVYRLARYLNEQYGYDAIPQNTLDKRPSAELAEDQYDPFDYEVVSPLVDDLLINKPVTELIEKTQDPDLVYRIMHLIRITEYKRWQAAPGLRVTSKAFGQGRKMPLINHFK